MSYYKTHKGKYVLATPNEIYRLDKVDVDISHDHPAGAPAGIYLKVGLEFEFAGEAFFGANLTSIEPVLPLSFGERGNPNLWGSRYL